ncbi:MAG: tryptophan--tRNA ligase [Actinobacteria bacterium 13_2_20CM_2_72_6]|nr:MAG: tryptophan--tRNA ligase [Actinobacteria bacterium 13_2_20CM_2_72_6]
MSRRLSGFQPTGHLHLGNLLGAIRPTVAGQDDHDSIILVVDLHAMTVEHDPALLRELTLEVATLLLAAGVDPARSLFYVQSHVPQHTELHYLLECATGYGEAHRMIQFKEKAAGQQHVRLSLLTYPTLMAADILLHDVEEVPVGADQSQHVELTRDIAVRFNGRYGPTFAVPKAVNPGFTSRIRDLSDPGAKMGKTNQDDAGVLYLLDPPEVIRRKVMRAVTDAGREVRYDPVHQPGVANLLDILAAATDETPTALAGLFGSYRALKEAVADRVVAMLQPIQARYADLRTDPGTVRGILRAGAERARDQTQARVREVRARLGLM